MFGGCLFMKICFFQPWWIEFALPVPATAEMSVGATEQYINKLTEAYSETMVAEVLRHHLKEGMITEHEWARLTRLAIKNFALKEIREMG